MLKTRHMKCKEKLNEYYKTEDHIILNDIFMTCHKMLVHWAYKRTKNLDVANELVHETFIVWKRNILLGKVSALNSCCGYAMNILKNKMMEYYRTSKRNMNTAEKHFDTNTIELEDYLDI